MGEVLFILAVGILGLLGLILIPKWMLMRNVHIVLRIFQEENAVGIQNAKTAEELGVEKLAIVKAWSQGKIFNRRDWKPYALKLLIDNNIVFMTQEGKLYITEKSLASVSSIILKK